MSALSSVLSLVGMGRSSIALAPSNPAVVYVMSAGTTTGGTGTHGLPAIYRSTSNGDAASFVTQVDGKAAVSTVADRLNRMQLTNPVFGFLSDCGFGSTGFYNQGWHDNVIAVDPLDSNRVWAGGVDLFRSDDGGVNWGTAGYSWFDKGVDPQYHHADQHGIVFHPQYNGTTNRIMFSASDGGHAAVDTLGDANAANDVLFAENTGLSIQRSINGGATFNAAVSGISGDNGFAFIAPFTMNQGIKQRLWTGGWYIWRTVNQGTGWVASTSTITALPQIPCPDYPGQGR